MKTSLTLLLSFLFISAQAQYKVDWSNAPMNPIPEIYTANHYHISGPVADRTDKLVKTVDTFNENGTIASSLGEYSNFRYKYDAAGNLSEINMEMGGFETKVSYKTNKQGFISEISYGDGLIYLLEYNAKGLYISKRNKLKKMPDVKHDYDSANRVIKTETYTDDKLIGTATYKYSQKGDVMIVEVLHTNPKKTGKTANHIYKYNKRGDKIFYDNKKSTYKYDSHNNIISGFEETFPISYEYVYKTSANNISPIDGCIAGNCLDGYGTMKNSHGSYTGFFENKLRTGYGTYIADTGEIIFGEWLNGARIGFGYYSYNNGDYLLGQFVGGHLTGLAITYKSGNYTYGIFNHGAATTKFEVNDTGKTIGCTSGNCFDKYGKYIYDNGFTFSGFFENGYMKQGVLISSEGNQYTGEFGKLNTFEGFGLYKFKNGDFYAGFFKNGKYNGKGVLSFKETGEKQIGEWKDNVLVKKY